MNPYAVLGIDKDASNRDIITAAALQMRQKKFSAKEIAQAQKLLLEPVSRACQEFLHCIDFNGIKERLSLPLEKMKTPGIDVPCLTLFDSDDHDL